MHPGIEALLLTKLKPPDAHEEIQLRRIHKIRSRYTPKTRFGRMVTRISISESMGRCIFSMVRAVRPKICLEVGTGVGISTLYIVAAMTLNRCGALWTLDGNHGRLALAHRHVAALKTKIPCRFIHGLFRETLGRTLKMLRSVDFVLVDDEHFVGVTLKRFPKLLAVLSQRGMLVYDDVLTPHMSRAWRTIKRRKEGILAIDCGRFGLVLPYGR